MQKHEYLKLNSIILRDKVVLDLACYTGESTKQILNNGARHVYGVEIREESINQAKQKVTDNVDFFLGDITDYNLLSPLVAKSQTITCFGVLYHLFDHFRFFSHILKSNIDYVLIETVVGPESVNPEMFWGFETTDNVMHGWADNCNLIPNGTPNLSWIMQSARIFNFECDWVHYYNLAQPPAISRKHLTYEDYTNIRDESWPPYTDIISETTVIPEHVANEITEMLKTHTDEPGNRRMILRLYNVNNIKSTPLDIWDNFEWPL